MGSKIRWKDLTWNPVVGTVASGCENDYSEQVVKKFGRLLSD